MRQMESKEYRQGYKIGYETGRKAERYLCLALAISFVFVFEVLNLVLTKLHYK